MLSTNCKKETASDVLWIMQQLENLRLVDEQDETKRKIIEDVSLFAMAYANTFSKDVKKASRGINVMNEILKDYETLKNKE